MERKAEKEEDKKKLDDEDAEDSDDDAKKIEGANDQIEQQITLKTKVKQAAFVKSGVKKPQ